MISIRTWKQENGIEIDESYYDVDAHAFAISADGRHVVTIYADSPEQTDNIRASLNANEDVRDWEDGNGHCVGTLITQPFSQSLTSSSAFRLALMISVSFGEFA